MHTPNLIPDLCNYLLGKIEELIEENERLRSLSLADGLTGVFNMRYFCSQLEIEMARVRRTHRPASLMMIDLDDLKAINDRMGHLEGNRAIVETVQVIRDKVRVTDIVCRYGGDEFAVIMPGTDFASALLIAGRLRHSLARAALMSVLPLSVSIGIAEAGADFSGSGDDLVRAADTALYRAKQSGKNRTCTEADLQQATSL